MPVKTAQAEWTGDFRAGCGVIKPGSGAFEADYSFGSIFSGAPGTSPTEVLGASLAGCFAGGLAAYLARDGFTPKRICTAAEVHLNPPNEGFTVKLIHLHTQAEVPGVDAATLARYAETVKRECPVGQALGMIEITVQAELI